MSEVFHFFKFTYFSQALSDIQLFSVSFVVSNFPYFVFPRPEAATARNIKEDDMYLCDSGGQYL